MSLVRGSLGDSVGEQRADHQNATACKTIVEEVVNRLPHGAPTQRMARSWAKLALTSPAYFIEIDGASTVACKTTACAPVKYVQSEIIEAPSNESQR